MTPAWTEVRDASLRARNTFGVDAKARWLLEIDSPHALFQALSKSEWKDAPLLPVGAGSNILFAGDFDGVALIFNLFHPDNEGEDAGIAWVVEDKDENVFIGVDAALNWHEFVLWSLRNGFSGLENLSLIPGTVGAAPIQNIGAYGVEVCEFIHRITAFDRAQNHFVELSRDDCRFSYRDSIFKNEPDRWLITSVEFRLPRNSSLKTHYAGIGEELAAMGITEPTPRDVSDAVIRIRRRKLPDPAVLGNAGSFFKNPIVPAEVAADLQSAHPDMPVFRGSGDDSRKLSAAWLIDQCGWKGHREGDAGVAPSHALVLVNHGHATGMQLLDLARRIAASVRERFGVAIEPEPRIVGARW